MTMTNEALERVARGIYSVRPFVMASTATTFGHQVAKTFDWDGAPAYYQEDMRDLARAALEALGQHSEGDALGYARRLAEALHEKHYPENIGWKPLPDLLGILTQIDNATSGLVRASHSEGDVERAICKSCGQEFDLAAEHDCPGLLTLTDGCGERTKLLELAERCEAATGPSYDLSQEIGAACGMEERYQHPGSENTAHRAYAASLDAAAALVPEGYEWATGTGRKQHMTENGKKPWAWCAASENFAMPEYFPTGATAPLALCAAALRTRASKEPNQ